MVYKADFLMCNLATGEKMVIGMPNHHRINVYFCYFEGSERNVVISFFKYKLIEFTLPEFTLTVSMRESNRKYSSRILRAQSCMHNFQSV